MVFSKGPLRDMIFLVLPGKMVFSPKTWYFFPWAESERWSFSRNTWTYDIFCVNVRVLQTWHHAPLWKKNQRWYYPAKIQLKVIDVLDWHSRKSSRNSLYLQGYLYRRFPFQWTKPGNLIYRIEVWLLLRFIRLEIFCNE